MINRRKLLSLIGISPALVATSSAAAAGDKHKKDAAPATPPDPKFVAVTPKGTPPPVMRFAMAPRTVSNLDGKTVYLVDTGFMAADVMIREVEAWMKQNMPSITTVSRKKAGTYPEDDPKLWAEIKANAAACIMAIGH
jgi:hypothetical protein